ncbi:MAG TPA: FMN-binding negative transcriptional regulator, partial [Amnibacterium sp.]|nr:FMN-binding negative transcriptional regulator [Amnibacterium sp.]
MRKNPSFSLADPAAIKQLIRENPWATIVSHTTEGLVASHYPVLVDEDREEL